MLLLTIIPSQVPALSVIPFVVLLLLIAAGPLLFHSFWHRWYKLIGVLIGSGMAIYYLAGLHQPAIVAETFAEYISFITMLLALFVASGGIYIFADFESKPLTNIAFLLAGAVLSNFIGTTGASVLLIRPFMRLNRYRLKPYHIVFFIFFVSNLGGLLTPIGDPPLFMGFLKGVPFFWTLQHLWAEWLIMLALLAVIFWFFEKRNTALDETDISAHYTNQVIIDGKRNFIWLGLIVISIFLDPNTIEGFPCIELHGKKISFIREIIQIAITYCCYRFSSRNALRKNDFDFEPIKEVAFLFAGIFLSMMPALQLLNTLGENGLTLSEGFMYWGAGLFSSLLDNAPTYVNFFTLALSMFGFDARNIDDVHRFLNSEHAHYLMAVSTGSVFFGAMTYIGNGPNFMVKSIAEQSGVKMPGFFRFIITYSLPILLPLLTVIWLIFYF